MSKTYDLKELAVLLKFTAPYLKMLLKGMGIDPAEPISEETAAQLAQRVSRPWPPEE